MSDLCYRLEVVGGKYAKWYDEEYEFCIEVTDFLHGDKTERYCRNSEEIGEYRNK